MPYSVVTDFYVGARTRFRLTLPDKTINLQLDFADVYQSEVGPHKTLHVTIFPSDPFPPMQVSAFEAGEISDDAQDYVRDIYANSPITLRTEDYVFDNYYYVGDGMNDTSRDPIHISFDSKGITAAFSG